MMKKAVIFDMDGVLIDSEPFWHKAEIEIFGKDGATLTEDMCVTQQGVKCLHVMQHWKELFPFLTRTAEEYAKLVEQSVFDQVTMFGKPMQGVVETLEMLGNAGVLRAVASASNYFQIYNVLDKLDIRECFDIIHSAQDEKFGKPAPDVFLHAAERLGVYPQDCIVVEDSGNGVLAGKRGGMTVVAVPEPKSFDNSAFDIADYKLHSLSEFTLDLLG